MLALTFLYIVLHYLTLRSVQLKVQSLKGIFRGSSRLLAQLFAIIANSD